MGWPARITGLGSKDRYKVYFYGTYETATLRSEDIWPYNPETKEKFATKNMKRKGYPEGIDQIENTPEIAPVEGEITDLDTTAEVDTPVVNEAAKKQSGKAATTPASKTATPAGKATPASKVTTPASKATTPAAKPAAKVKETPKTVETPKALPARATSKRKASQASEEETPAKKAAAPTPAPIVETTPANSESSTAPVEQKVSRSGRALKPKKFAEGMISSPKPTPAPPADADKENTKVIKSPVKKEEKTKVSPIKTEAEPRKMWVKVKDTDDLIEINLDKDRPESFESNEAKIEWEMASARKALKFKKRVESGEFIPPEIKKKLEEKEKLSDEDKAVLDREKLLEKRKNKLRWLKIEQRRVDLDIAVKTSLHLERPAPDECIKSLDELNELALAPLMLKKQPDIVTTIRRLRKYIGPQNFCNWPDKSAREKMEKDIQVIQAKADQIYEKFKSYFAFQEGDKTFWDAFEAEVNEFKEKTAGLDESKILSMIRDPTKPLSNLNPLSDDEDL